MLCPYQNLYIYLIKGVISENDALSLGHAFIGNWVEDDSSFLFFSEPAGGLVDILLKTHPEFELVDHYQFTYEQWQGGGLEPVQIESFVIVPYWKDIDIEDSMLKIKLDPGVVFGNGLHPTTKDCIRSLAYAEKERHFNNVLDLGTGTEILALAAALLGAKKVLALDLNPLCVKTAVNNVRINGFNDVIRVLEAPAENMIDEPADLIIANMHYEVISSFLEKRSFQKKERMIISGLMRSQYRDLKMLVKKYSLRLVHEWEHNITWFTVLVERD